MNSRIIEEKDIQKLFFKFLSLKKEEVKNLIKILNTKELNQNDNLNEYKLENISTFETSKIQNLNINLNNTWEDRLSNNKIKKNLTLELINESNNELNNELNRLNNRLNKSNDILNNNLNNRLNSQLDYNIFNELNDEIVNNNINDIKNSELKYEIRIIFDEMGYCIRNTNNEINQDKFKLYINFNTWERKIVVELLGLGKFCSKTLYNISLDNIDNNDNDYYNIDNIEVEQRLIENLLLNKLNLIKGNTIFNYYKILCYLSRSNNYIYPMGFKPLLLEIINRHFSLRFLVNNLTFKDLFVNTVISRIYYELDLLELHKLRYKDVKNSDLMYLLRDIKGESFEDLVHYFSYQHFYVLYCRFIELDHDEDQLLSYTEFRNHDFGALSENASDRIWKCNILSKKSIFQEKITQNRKMDYYDFLYFYISDEDKTTEKSIKYWFEIIDLDCDGWISNKEIEYFYNEQIKRCSELNYNLPDLTSILCMMNDLLMPSIQSKYRLNDFQKNKFLASHFFNILVNTKKCLSTIFMDGEFNIIHSLIENQIDKKIYSPWDLHCQYQYQIIQEDNYEE